MAARKRIFDVLTILQGLVQQVNVLFTSQQLEPTVKAAAATLTVAELLTQIVQYTGAAANISMPTATVLDAAFASYELAANQAFTFSIVNTGSGTATLAGNTGVTVVGSGAVAAGASGTWKVRTVAPGSWGVYRIA